MFPHFRINIILSADVPDRERFRGTGIPESVKSQGSGDRVPRNPPGLVRKTPPYRLSVVQETGGAPAARADPRFFSAYEAANPSTSIPEDAVQGQLGGEAWEGEQASPRLRFLHAQTLPRPLRNRYNIPEVSMTHNPVG